MRAAAGDVTEEDSEGLSTLMPVLFGDNGEAMIGAGKVRRFRYVGVR